MLKKILIGALSLLLVSLPGKAAVIALWDFEDETTSTSYSADSGSGTLGTFTGTQSIGTDAGNEFLDFSTGGSFIIHVSGTGFTDFQVTYQAQKNGMSPSVTWGWSTTGSGFVTTGVSPGSDTPGSSFSTFFVQSFPSDLNNVSDVYLQASFGSAVDFDNISVSGVPEPVNVALACFGVAFVGLTFGRRVYAMARSQRAVIA